MFDFGRVAEAVRHEGGVSRRLLLRYAAALAAIPLLADRTAAIGPTTRPSAASFRSDPFALGVASGDPDPTSVVLWTRLAPRPLEPDGGMRPTPVNVRWEVATDESMRKVVRSGTATAAPGLGHSVHVEAHGLEPDRWYWYRFRAGDADSPVGRTRTMPAPAATPRRLRFAFASCQHYEAGLYTAYGRMVEDELDLIVHLGDYIYEGAPNRGGVRTHHGPAARTLETYRMRYAQYRTDPLLQAAHRKCPWLVTWDDHEVFNNYAAGHAHAEGITTADVLARRAAAYQAYYEAMPLRRRSLPRGADMDLYRAARFGRLAAFHVLDTRQYRTPQPGAGRVPLGPAATNSNATILGAKQGRWLRASLAASPAAWNVLAQQVMMGMVDSIPGPEKGYHADQWPAYTHDRVELMRFIADRKVRNPVALAGDIHSNWVNDLRVDDRESDGPVVATEFVGTSISSGGNGVDRPANLDTLTAENACVRFHNRERGYVRCEVTPHAWRSDFVTVSDVTKPRAPTAVRATFVVEAGRPGAQPA